MRDAAPGIPGYELKRLLGRGGMGEVWTARHVGLDRDVAVKLIRPGVDGDDTLRRFRREAQVSASLSHSGVVKILDTGVTADGRPFYAMELVRGPTLEELAGDGELPLRLVRKLLLQGAETLAAVHAAGCVHRDIKPANLMVDENERLLLMDFGLVHIDGRTMLTGTGELLGTPRFMPPEMFLGEECSPAGDVYALGLSFWRVVARRLPFGTRSLPDMVVQVNAGVPPLSLAVPDVPADISSLIEAMTALDRARRPTAADVVRAARALTSRKSSAAVAPARRTRRRVRIGAVALSAGAIVASAMLAWLTRPPRAPSLPSAVAAPARSPAAADARPPVLRDVRAFATATSIRIAFAIDPPAPVEVEVSRTAGPVELTRRQDAPRALYCDELPGREPGTTYQVRVRSAGRTLLAGLRVRTLPPRVEGDTAWDRASRLIAELAGKVPDPARLEAGAELAGEVASLPLLDAALAGVDRRDAPLLALARAAWRCRDERALALARRAVASGRGDRAELVRVLAASSSRGPAAAEEVARAVEQLSPAPDLRWARPFVALDPDAARDHALGWLASHGTLHRTALTCLAALGGAPERDALVNAARVRDGDSEAAVALLAELADLDAVARLQGLLEHPSLRLSVLWGICRACATELSPAECGRISRILESTDPVPVRCAAAAVLGQCLSPGRAPPAVVASLRRAAADPSVLVAREALVALARLEDRALLGAGGGELIRRALKFQQCAWAVGHVRATELLPVVEQELTMTLATLMPAYNPMRIASYLWALGRLAADRVERAAAPLAPDLPFAALIREAVSASRDPKADLIFPSTVVLRTGLRVRAGESFAVSFAGALGTDAAADAMKDLDAGVRFDQDYGGTLVAGGLRVPLTSATTTAVAEQDGEVLLTWIRDPLATPLSSARLIELNGLAVVRLHRD